jgi:hypothetical protein
MLCARTILSSVTCPVLQYFPTFSHKWKDFRKRYWTQSMCFDFLYNFCLKHFSFLEELRTILSKMYIGLYVKYRLLLSDFNKIWIFLTGFSKSTYISNFIKKNPSRRSRFFPCGRTDRLNTDRHTDVTKLILAFRRFAVSRDSSYVLVYKSQQDAQVL